MMLIVLFLLVAGVVVGGTLVFLLIKTILWLQESKPRTAGGTTDPMPTLLPADSPEISWVPPILTDVVPVQDEEHRRRSEGSADVIPQVAGVEPGHGVPPTDPGTCADPGMSSGSVDSTSGSDWSPSCGGSESSSSCDTSSGAP